MESAAGEVTRLLRAWGEGDRSVEQRLFEIVVPDLRRFAHGLMRRERPGNALQTSSLLNEAYLRLCDARELDWQSRTHFYALCARIMRRLLIDKARGRKPVVPIDGLEELLAGRQPQIEQALAIDGLLEELERLHPTWCQILELRFFVGLNEQETAEALNLPLRSAQRQYAEARRWLYKKLE
jgi:RNA polymerase sigma factor (TIGR02999 family)